MILKACFKILNTCFSAPNQQDSQALTHGKCKICKNCVKWDSSNLFIHLGGCLSTKDDYLALLNAISSKKGKKFLNLKKRLEMKIKSIDDAHREIFENKRKRGVTLKFVDVLFVSNFLLLARRVRTNKIGC